jgi:formyltetrahydrofolate deformylase
MKLSIRIHCPDKKGIISETTNFLQKEGGNIVYLDQFVDRENNIFFMRIEVVLKEDFSETAFKQKFDQEIAIVHQMSYEINDSLKKVKMGVFVSKYNHCLYDILARYQAGDWNVEIPFIVSNHQDLEAVAKQFNIPYFHIPITKETKREAEKKQLQLLKDFEVDFIVLARYMQIIPSEMIQAFPNKIINIHHSFLPAFAGAKPYHAAYERGVKIIGATSHYVTEELDAGPIIEQDITIVSHVHSVHDFILKGRDLEKIVLSKAITKHLDRKTIVYNNKTVIFS